MGFLNQGQKKVGEKMAEGAYKMEGTQNGLVD